jgi:uncharacterized protein
VVVKPVFVRLNPQECLARLVPAPIGRVAVSIDALPTVRSVRFALIGDSVVFRVAPESRLRRAVVGTVIAFHADHYDEGERQGRSVVIHGVADEVKDPTTVAQLRALPLEAWADPRPMTSSCVSQPRLSAANTCRCQPCRSRGRLGS